MGGGGNLVSPSPLISLARLAGPRQLTAACALAKPTQLVATDGSGLLCRNVDSGFPTPALVDAGSSRYGLHRQSRKKNYLQIAVWHVEHTALR